VPQFVDKSQIHVKAGDGGAGSVAFRREAHVAMGGPDGGDGGKGGDVWIVTDHNVASLLAFRDHPFRRGESGTHGQGQKQHGASGTDEIIRVPIGTVIRDPEGTVIADLSGEGDRWLAAEGGKGGQGNARFLTNKRRAPGFAEQGEVGEEHWYNAELKLLADVALVGFPNAGKSTLISRISAAKPKIANYPFTTLTPNLGVVRLDDSEFVVADVPGLIEGASEGRGLGHEFLRHIERARVIVILLDLASVDEKTPEQQLELLLVELEAYRPELLERPRIIVGAKTDVATYEWDGMNISAVTGRGIQQLVGIMATQVVEARKNESSLVDAVVVHRPAPTGISVRRDEYGQFHVEGRDALRAVNLNDLTNIEALMVVRERLDRLGVPKALRRAGVSEGDTVIIGSFAFDYEDDI
jgi:GTPase